MPFVARKIGVIAAATKSMFVANLSFPTAIRNRPEATKTARTITKNIFIRSIVDFMTKTLKNTFDLG